MRCLLVVSATLRGLLQGAGRDGALPLRCARCFCEQVLVVSVPHRGLCAEAPVR